MQTHQTTRRPPTTTPAGPTVHDTHLVDEMDQLLDDIDAALEENALEITRTYIQRGGQ
jgi:ubiquitin-like protein Pup